MPKKQLYIIDPFEKLQIERDTSVLLINEAVRRGDEVYSTTEYDISRLNGRLICRALRHKTEIDGTTAQASFPAGEFDLEEFALIVVRKDPPFDGSYLTLLLLLLGLRRPLVVNDPVTLLKYNEKLAIFHFPEFITDSLVSSSREEIETFTGSVGGLAVLKPLFSCSGRGVELLDLSAPSFRETVLGSTSGEKEKVIVQRYLPAVKEGEVRVFLLAAKPLAVIKKVPAPGTFKANFDCGAVGLPHRLDGREEELCSRVGEFCRKEGIILSALDIIDGRLSELNITSPGLLVESKAVNGVPYEKEIIEFLNARLTG